MDVNSIRPRGALAVLLVLCAATAAYAHNPVPPHGCQAPTRPANDQDDVLWESYLAAVDRFRACISDFATANHQAAERHHEAANAATLDWNRFVRDELNVPEDFPWPPES
jgi:hypothetical protein